MSRSLKGIALHIYVLCAEYVNHDRQVVDLVFQEWPQHLKVKGLSRLETSFTYCLNNYSVHVLIHIWRVIYSLPSISALNWLKYLSLTHWGRVTHICVGKLTIIGSDNGLSSGRRQAMIWTNAGILLIEHLGTNFSQIIIKINTFSFKKMYLKMSSGKWRPFCFGLNVLSRLQTSYVNFLFT